MASMRFRSQTVFSGVTDIIVVQRDDGTLHSTPFNVRIGKLKYIDLLLPKQLVSINSFDDNYALKSATQLADIQLYVNQIAIDVQFSLNLQTSLGYFVTPQEMQDLGVDKSLLTMQLSKIPNDHQLKKMNLQFGENFITYEITCKKLGICTINCKLFVIKSSVKIFISDIDGTVTKSPVVGMLLSNIGYNYTHAGICKFYTLLLKQGYFILYMSARSMNQYQPTLEYLKRQNQQGYTLPNGPILLSDQELMEALTIELIKKQSCLMKSRLLKQLHSSIDQDHSLYSGIGDKLNDIQAYRSIGIPYERIYLIDKNSNIIRKEENGNQTQLTFQMMSEQITTLFPLIQQQDQQYQQQQQQQQQQKQEL